VEKISSKIIKADQHTGMVIPMEMTDLLEAVDCVENTGVAGLLEESGLHEELSLEDDEVDIEEISRLAFEEGYSSGKSDGVEMGEKKVEPVIEGFGQSVRDLAVFKDRLIRESEKEIVDLIIMAARKIVHKEISTDREIIAHVVKSALKSLTDRKEIAVYLNPEDHSLIAEHKNRLFGDVDDLKNLTFFEDEAVKRGGCLIESRYGEVDARIEKQLEQLEKELISAVNG